MANFGNLLGIFLLGAVLIYTILSGPQTLVQADCCYPAYINCSGTMQVACLDCSPPTPFCGSDQCNVMGCNCTCRTTPPKIVSQNGDDIINAENGYWFYNVSNGGDV